MYFIIFHKFTIYVLFLKTNHIFKRYFRAFTYSFDFLSEWLFEFSSFIHIRIKFAYTAFHSKIHTLKKYNQSFVSVSVVSDESLKKNPQRFVRDFCN